MNAKHNLTTSHAPKAGQFLAGAAAACAAMLVCLPSPALAETMPDGSAAMNPPKAAASVCKERARKAIEEQIAAIPEAQRTQLLQIVNEGDEQAISALPGIAGTRSKAIQAARPFASIADLLRVPGIGSATLVRLLKHDPSAPRPVSVGMGMGS